MIGAGATPDDSAVVGERPGFLGTCSLMASLILMLVGLFSMAIVLPQIALDFPNEPHAALFSQLIGSSAGFAFAITSPFVGRFIERFGYRRIYIFSLIVFAVAGTAPAFLHSLSAILTTRIVLGSSVATAFTACATGISRLPPDQHARMLGRQALVGGCAGLVIFPVVGLLADHGWRLPFGIHLIALLILPMALTLPEDPAGPVGHTTAEPAARATGLSIAVILVTIFVGMASFVAAMYAPFYLNSIGITQPSLISLTPTMSVIGSIVASAVYGTLRRRFDSSQMFKGTLWLIAIGLLIGGCSSTMPLFIVGIFFYGLGQSTFVPNIVAFAIDRAKGNPALGIGILMGMLNGGPILGPFVTGLISHLGGPASVFLSFGAIALLLAIFYDPGENAQPWWRRLLRSPVAPQADAAYKS